MRSERDVVLPPAFDDDLRFLQRVEDFAIKELVAELRVEALAIAVLPRAAGHDVGGLGADGSDPSAQGLGDELGAGAVPSTLKVVAGSAEKVALTARAFASERCPIPCSDRCLPLS